MHLLNMKHSTILGTGDTSVNEIDMVPGFMELNILLGAGKWRGNNILSDSDKHYEENEQVDVIQGD